jgi:hypothetical protein
MTKKEIDETIITRLEVHGGEPHRTRHMSIWDIKNVQLSSQDGGRTLKVFFEDALDEPTEVHVKKPMSFDEWFNHDANMDLRMPMTSKLSFIQKMSIDEHKDFIRYLYDKYIKTHR